jgi:hypothetical protein
MAIIDDLKGLQGGAAVAALAKEHGVTPEAAGSVIDAVVPALAARMERNTLSRGGVADLVAEMMKPEHGQLLSDPGRVATPAAAQAGVGALDTILGSKAASRNIAAQAALSSGVTQAIIQKLLPIIASMVMAALSKGSQGGLGDILRRLPDLAGGGGGGGNPIPGPQPRNRRPADPQPEDDSGSDGGFGDVLRRIPGLPGSTQGSPLPVPGQSPRPSWPEPEPTLPSTGRSSPIPQAPRPAGDTPFGGGSPLPLPGDRIPGVNAPADPYGRLPDVIRQGGATVDGSPLGGVIRNILGSLLGFQSKGFLGWAIRLLVLRWGWGFVQSILRRLLAGR